MTFVLLYAVIPYFIYAISSSFRKPNLLFIYLLLLSLFRFDNVTDYHNYVKIFQNISVGSISDKLSFETGYVVLNRLFSFWDFGYIIVIAIATLAAYYALYLYFKRYEILPRAMLLFCALGSNIVVDNIVRQNIAFAIVNIAFFNYLYKDRPLWIVAVACMIASTFHVSALIMIPVYMSFPLLKRKILSPLIICVVTLSAYVLMLTGIFETIFIAIFNKILPSLGVLYERFAYHEGFDTINASISITTLFKTLISLLPVLIIDKIKDKNIVMFINITWISKLFELVFGSIPNITRITDYFIIFELVAIAYFVITFKNGKYYIGSYRVSTLLKRALFIPLFILSLISTAAYFGSTTKYTSVFSYRCREGLFYERAAFTDIESNNENINAGRERFYKRKP